jgi:hypothetical protein
MLVASTICAYTADSASRAQPVGLGLEMEAR